MRSRRRGIFVTTLMLCAILLVISGIGGLRKLMVVDKVPSETLGRQVGCTVGALFLGLTVIVWCLTSGIGSITSTQPRTENRKRGLGQNLRVLTELLQNAWRARRM